MLISKVIHNFENNILPLGESSYPFTFDLPPDLPQSMQTRETNGEYRGKIKYFFKVQVVPVNTELLLNEDGKSLIRTRDRILYSPIRPIVIDPQLNILTDVHKKAGIMKRDVDVKITVNKNFFFAGEIAYLTVVVDNTKCNHACNMIVEHSHKLKITTKSRKTGKTFVNKSEKFFLAHAG